MSRLKELVEQLCPDGVEYRPIKELYTKLRGTPITAATMKKIADDDGDTIIFAGGKTVVRANESDIPKANVIRRPSVVVQSRGVIDFIYCDEPFTFKNEMWAYTCDDVDRVKYLCYVLRSNAEKFRTLASAMSSLPQIASRDTEMFCIPVPPIEVQREVVRILDSFQELDDALTAEIEARKTQLGAYRDELLGSRLEKICPNGVEYKKVKQVATIRNGKDHKSLADGDIPVYGSGGVMRYVDTASYDKPSVLLPRKGSLNNVFYVDTPFWNVDTIFHTVINECLVVPKYFYYVMCCAHIENYGEHSFFPVFGGKF